MESWPATACRRLRERAVQPGEPGTTSNGMGSGCLSSGMGGGSQEVPIDNFPSLTYSEVKCWARDDTLKG